MVMIMSGRGSASQSGSTIPYHEAAPYQIHQPVDMCRRLPNLTRILASPAKMLGGFGLVWVAITIAYQSADLSLGRSRDTFTNDYRRTEGRDMTEYYIGLELVVGGAVDEGYVVFTFIG